MDVRGWFRSLLNGNSIANFGLKKFNFLSTSQVCTDCMNHMHTVVPGRSKQ